MTSMDMPDSKRHKETLFRKICLIGIYVKRCCNLRLMEQSREATSRQEPELSFDEMLN